MCHARFPRNLKAFFGTFQNSCSNYMANFQFSHCFTRHNAFLAVFIAFHFCLVTFPCTFVQIMFDISEAHIEPSQTSKMESLPKIVEGF